MRKVISAEGYDDLSTVQKHIMLKNGTFDFNTHPPQMCTCGHSSSEHLDGTNCCLIAKNDICLCLEFVNKNTKTVKKDNGLPKNQNPKEIQQDARIQGYIQQISKI